MGALLIFAFISGFITILAPCIWPLLPVILSSTSLGGRARPLGIALGIATSFAFFTLTLSTLVKLFPFDPNALRLFAVFVIGFLGLTLLIPRLSAVVEGYVSRLTGMLEQRGYVGGTGLLRGFITGMSLGIVWSPCAGPILATIAALSSIRAVTTDTVILTMVYAAGIAVPLFLFATFGNWLFSRSRGVGRLTPSIQRIFGAVMIITAVLIATNTDKVLEAKLLNIVPSYSNFIISFENNPMVQNQLNVLKGKEVVSPQPLEQQAYSPVTGSKLPDLGMAPEFTGITHWLNTDKPLTMAGLRGKVVLIDFWTYTCINCIRTLPHLTMWYDKYKDKGLVIVGVHTPEFEFEKETRNVQEAMDRFGIKYPVAEDNDYATWNAYGNQYWPAEYLVDGDGHIRHTHFGEGEYDTTESTIQKLLAEEGKKIDMKVGGAPDTTPRGFLSPETYLGINRMERFDSNESPTGGKQVFTSQDTISLDHFSFRGTWNLQPEYAGSSQGSSLMFHFQAGHVYLVMHPAKKGDTVRVFLDGKPILQEAAGKDVKDGVVTLDAERLYDLVDLKGRTEEHTLRLEFGQDGTGVFAFTFG